jgi:hypothetical protein
MASQPDDLEDLRERLRKRDIHVMINSEMKVSPEIESHLLRLLQDRITKARDVGKEIAVEIPKQAALWLIEVLELRRRSRGRPKVTDDPGPNLIVQIASLLKTRYMKDGMNATEAELQAAEEGEREARQHKIKLSAETIRRRMQSDK